MARNKNRLGSIASEIMSYGDTDLMQSRDAHNDMLNTAEKMALNDVRAQVRSYIGKVKFKRDAVVSHLSARETKRTEYAETKSDLVEQSELWKNVGIRERIALWSIPKSAKTVVWLLLAALDFYLFSEAIAYAQGVTNPSPSDTQFWIGGGFGLVVFIVGVIVAQQFRKITYVKAQKRLYSELEQSDADLAKLQVGDYSLGSAVASALVFVILLAAAALVRSVQTAGLGDGGGALTLQSLVPVVAVVVEMLINDPTEVGLKQPGPVDWVLTWRLRRLERKLSIREEVAMEREDAVKAKYEFEKGALSALHESHGFQ